MKKPFAYITAVWKGGEFTVIDQAAVYCRKVYEAGFTPICPVLYLPHFLRDSIPAEHKDGIDIGRELLRRSHVLIVCGDEVDESVKNDIAVAQRLGITATMGCGQPHGRLRGRQPCFQKPGCQATYGGRRHYASRPEGGSAAVQPDYRLIGTGSGLCKA